MARIGRRAVLQGSMALGLGAATMARAEEMVDLPFGNGERPLVRYSQKRPLIRQTTRPPQLETPFSVYGEGLIAPNDAFFVRYHLLGNVPSQNLDPGSFRVEVKGRVRQPLSLPRRAEGDAGRDRDRRCEPMLRQ